MLKLALFLALQGGGSGGVMDVPWYDGMPPVFFAPARSRYNRIEALSLAAVAGRRLRDDRTIAGMVRLGIADVVPNSEFEYTWERPAGLRSISLYHRLAVSNDWGDPLALGASLGALLIGRDEGFYYRAGGAELRVVDSTRHRIDARIFVERHRPARVKNDWSLADAFGDHQFDPNIEATSGDIAGFAMIGTWRRGELATDFRFLGEVKVEAAVGDFDYSRGMFELNFSHPLGGMLLPSIMTSAGVSGGTLPIQRNWFIGGTRSIRGQRAGVMSGDAFWLTQLEIGTFNVMARPVIFFDVGWAGSRDNFSSPGRVSSGAGIGGSFFDGSMRFDLARGIYPTRGWRGSLYLESRL